MKTSIIQSKKGMTIVELMVAMVIFTLVMVVLYSIYFSSLANVERNKEANVIRQQTSIGIRKLAAGLREISGPDDEDIVVANANELTFYADVENDDVIERVHYYLSNSKLMRGIVEPAAGDPLDFSGAESSTEVADYILNNGSNPLFRYYDSTGQLTSLPLSSANREAVVSINIKVLSDKDTSKPPKAINLETKVYLRNRKSE
ncbi:MAG: prepilin-type N-terminal cleavage/methylation domain-containing protein [Actinobacteria bacterium]|nr:MAG: prepilin-type N-terminal cleavage/methylation domain-containing protein [Actinomycetota bacterium]